MSKRMPDNVITSEVDTVMDGVPNKEEKQDPYGELIVTTECITL